MTEEPLPAIGRRAGLSAVWSSAPDSVYAVGGFDGKGVILHKY